jgi:predicted SnoaL-like aldol condensation-catalyzing enzyme
MRFLFRADQLGSGRPVASKKAEEKMNRRHFIAAASTAAGAHAMPAIAQESGAKSLPERFAATLSAHDIPSFAALFADDYVNHQVSAAAAAAAPPPPPPPDKSPKQATVGFFAARLAGIPDLKVAVEATVASNDMVAASFIYTGTHGGTYFGVAPTGRSLRFTSCDIFRVKNGQCAEHWGMGDIAGILAQLRASHP